MLEVGVDLHLDVHGDESISVNFVDGCEGIPSYDQRQKTLEDNFKALLLAITPEFQDQHGYDKDEPETADLSIATNWVGERFKCLALTIQMPFKDHDELPDDRMGWSDQRSRILGRDFLTAI
jgi:murein tripeptide amidase MpaA